MFPNNGRTVEILLRKCSSRSENFLLCAEQKLSIGDPMMPPDVRNAKEIREKLKDRAKLCVVEEFTAEDLLPDTE